MSKKEMKVYQKRKALTFESHFVCFVEKVEPEIVNSISSKLSFNLLSKELKEFI